MTVMVGIHLQHQLLMFFFVGLQIQPFQPTFSGSRVDSLSSLLVIDSATLGFAPSPRGVVPWLMVICSSTWDTLQSLGT